MSKWWVKSQHYCGNRKCNSARDQKRKGNIVVVGVKGKIKYLHLRDETFASLRCSLFPYLPPPLSPASSLIFALTRKLLASDLMQVLAYVFVPSVFFTLRA